jgi:hypothetical protein
VSSAVGPIEEAPGVGGSDVDGRAGATVWVMSALSRAREPESLWRAGGSPGG